MNQFEVKQAVAECGVMLKQIDDLMARNLVDEAEALLDRVEGLQAQIATVDVAKAVMAAEAFVPRSAWRGGRACF